MIKKSLCVMVLGYFTVVVSDASTLYVDINSTNSIPPYASWETAAVSIQPAVNAAVAGNSILVADGTYVLSSEILVNKAINIQSVNGPTVTIIDGDQRGSCFNLGSYSNIVSGFTIQNGKGHYSSGYYNGGGVWCNTSTAPVLSNCVIRNNSASYYGGGMYYGTANNCDFTNNTTSRFGGGIYSGTANNCFFIDNSAQSGGGIRSGIANNCTFNNNSAQAGGGMYSGTANNCAFIENTASSSGGGLHSGTANNCTFIDNSANSLGGGMADCTANNCIIWFNSATSGGSNLQSTTTHYCCSPELAHGINGNITNNPVFISPYHISPLSPCHSAGSSQYTSRKDIDGQPWLNPPSMGCDEYYAFDERPIYVAQTGDDFNDGRSWLTAKATIQAGVGAQLFPLGQVYVSNGTYVVDAEILVNKAITIQSVNGPAATIVDGKQQGSCFNLERYANFISGFTIQNGTGHNDGGVFRGGGIYCFDTTPVISNCIFRNNTARDGGGMSFGTANDCVFTGNSASSEGGGMRYGIANSCSFTSNSARYGGGISSCMANGSTFSNNSATSYGGGMYFGTANKCSFSENLASSYGGGISSGTASNCVISGNSAGLYGGGISDGVAIDCQIENNFSEGDGGGMYAGTATGCQIINNFSIGDGGGMYLGTATQCIVQDNECFYSNGGGLYQVDAQDCSIIGNSAKLGGGMYQGTAVDCVLSDNFADIGGGLYQINAVRCTISGNEALLQGGGMYQGNAENSLVIANVANQGGGIYAGAITNCTLLDNNAPTGGHIYGGTAYNSILQDTSSVSDMIYLTQTAYCCSPHLRHGVYGNITNNPAFADPLIEDYRLSNGSSCINAGINGYVLASTDRDGSPRIQFSTVDIGAYEYGGSDYNADDDNDGLSNANEAKLGTDPNNPDSDGDGFVDGIEVLSRMDPLVSDDWIPEYISNNGETYGLYSSNIVLDVAVGQMLLTTTNGQAHLLLQLEQATDLTTDSWTNAGDFVEWVLPVDACKQFFRVRSAPPE